MFYAEELRQLRRQKEIQRGTGNVTIKLNVCLIRVTKRETNSSNNKIGFFIAL